MTPENLFNECLSALARRRISCGRPRDLSGHQQLEDIKARQAAILAAKKDLAKGPVQIARGVFLHTLKDLVETYQSFLEPPTDESVLANAISLALYYHVATGNPRPTDLKPEEIRIIFISCFPRRSITLGTVRSVLQSNPPAGLSGGLEKNGLLSFEMGKIQLI